MLEAFAREHAETSRVHIVNTPIGLIEKQSRAPYPFVIKAFLERDTNWKIALRPDPQTLVLYDKDSPDILAEYFSDTEQRIAAKVRTAVAEILAKKNPGALIAEQAQPSHLAERWKRIAHPQAGLIYKIRKMKNRSTLPGTLIAGKEWVFRDADTFLTIATPWEGGTQTLEEWMTKNPGNKLKWQFLANAFRDAASLHKQGLLFMDWTRRNVAVNLAAQPGWLFDYETVIPFDSKAIFLQEALARELAESPGGTERGMTKADDLYAAAAFVREVSGNVPPLEAIEPMRIAAQMERGEIDFAKAASLLDNLAI